MKTAQIIFAKITICLFMAYLIGLVITMSIAFETQAYKYQNDHDRAMDKIHLWCQREYTENLNIIKYRIYKGDFE